ncbi:type 1 glutamine amidotransferase [Corynebacterium sp. 13CS0277]|uniref:type 1 glutamine amidotransferase n=1 Tax=Corynebacterium sp. 13CS0277 TaxID=2071994 RepID=UPI00130483A2|nr:gamma-glutamyl-gamma-aminobutyrate hydrolase family protein [Corynebacterium sp. 13CS0277]
MRELVFIQHEADIPPGTLADEAHAAGATTRVIAAWEAGGIAALEDLGRTITAPGAGERLAVVVLGGRENAYSEERWPWIPATKDIIRACATHDVPLVGVCLGMQLIAATLGGAVACPASAGPEYGVRMLRGSLEVDTAHTDENTQDTQDTSDSATGTDTLVVFEDHGDAVSVIPPGFTVTAVSGPAPDGAWTPSGVPGTTPDYPQVLRRGRITGVQFHPEVTPRIVHDFLADNDDVDREHIMADYLAHSDRIRAVARKLVGQLLAPVV